MFKETKEIKLEAKGDHGARKEDVENINNNEKIDEPLMERSMCQETCYSNDNTLTLHIYNLLGI